MTASPTNSIYEITAVSANPAADVAKHTVRDDILDSSHAKQNDTPPVQPRRRSTLRTFTIMTGLCCTLLIAALNQTIVATAIPTICAELNSASGYAWISASYALANGTSAPVWAKISDIWGRKRILLTAVALYFFTSIICATARSMKMLIIGRAFQGASGGGLVQMVYITISDLYSMQSRTMYLGFLQLMWAIAGGIGPVVGGSFAEFVGWRWAFWINLPVSGFAFFLLTFLDVHNPKTRMIEGIKAIDWFGILSLVGLMVMLLLGLNFGGGTLPWNSPAVVCLIVFGALMSVCFFISEKKLARYPLMPLALFRRKSNVAVFVVGFMHDFAVFATEFYLPLYFQSVKGASPHLSGLLILPVTLTQALVGIITSVVVYRTGRYREPIWIGVVFLTLGNGLYINLKSSSRISEIVGYEIITACGTGLLFQPPLIALQAVVTAEDTATATATLGFIRSLSVSLAIVLGGVVFQAGMDMQGSRLVAAGLPTNTTELLSGHAAAANIGIIETIGDVTQRLVVKDAFAVSLRNIWIMCTCTSACAIIASIFIARRTLSKVHVETKTGLRK
ncbi:major facilitator superfamily domain-containing protein [Dendryphion nanum]|uniref:Major facilitator superfamily domain-containing protein n=1 Tax=Dendryphion nanum TaxID=256645 RepID=A0A9P9IA30_9PLEO|nr:major facilitator superfamily domain-containing protein [Dendryphion nanum]